MIKHSYHYVYKITNLNNGKFYIGKHSTSKLKDDYMGSGTLIKRAIKKEGIHNFKKEILRYFSFEEDALNYERKLISEIKVDRFNRKLITYNNNLINLQNSISKSKYNLSFISKRPTQEEFELNGNKSISLALTKLNVLEETLSKLNKHDSIINTSRLNELLKK